MTFRFSACLLSVALLCACSTSAENIGLDLAPGVEDTSDAASVPDLAPDVAGPDLTQPDTTLPDFQIEPDLTVDTAPEIPTPQCDPGEGCFLDKCEENSQCESGWCVEHMGEGVCSSLCEDECPSGWSCKQVGAGGPDVIYICVSDFSNLCKPCTTTEGCKAVGGAEDVCIDYGAEGSFCGGACDAGTGAGEECPWGFSCADVLTVEGVELSQCIADAGVCPCTGKSIDLALTTPCQISNEFGSCDGKRVCTEGGLSHCDALVPESETCNGIDDNCDGDVDEPDEVAGDYINLCFDDNDCSQDLCNGEAGCEYLPLDGDECKDGDPCTAADLCVQGVCVGDPVVCEDGNPCTDDVCTENGGCDHLPNQEDCDDGDPCTLGDACKNSVCSGVQVPCDCQADADCADLEDDDACNGSLVCDLSALPYQCAVDPDSVIVCPPPLGVDAFCLTPQCDPATGGCSMAPDNEGLLCDNGDACTANDKCAGGACSAGSGVNCNDGNVCTDDSCDPNSGCQYDANSMACSDGNVCTTEDTCAGGACVGGQGLICDDDNACNGIETCDSDAGCLAGEPLACDDGDVCNGQETCAPGQGCQSGTPLNCDDNNPCTLDQCNPQTGCQNVAQPGNCDDGNACTTGDHCVDGDCVYEELEECDDENLCTDDYCDPAVGCITTLNDAPCDDGNACTTGDQCQLGGCAGGDEIVCDDGNICTDDSCDPLAGCQFAPNNDECDDDNECTANDKCKAGWCAPGEQQECDDGNVCTDDSCDPVLGCVFQTNAVPCDDGNTCTTGDHCELGSCVSSDSLTCNDGNICTDDSCDPDAGCQFDANNAPCDDGNPCTTGDSCQAAWCSPGQPMTCDDGNSCTEESCNPATGCVFDDLPDGAPCLDGGVEKVCVDGQCVCNPDCVGKECGPDGCGGLCGTCDDDDLCTLNEECVAGSCVKDAKTCDDGELCTDDSCNPATGCVFQHNAAPCDDQNPCTINDACSAGACSGDPVPNLAPWQFSNAGAGGRYGPSQGNADTAYAGTTLANSVTVSGGIQSWQVPSTGTYTIEAAGAKGGDGPGDGGHPGTAPGKGAKISGEFELQAGTTLKIVVGQMGSLSKQGGWQSAGCSGGGGGSYVYSDAMSETPLLAAAGGGGQAEDGAGGHGSANTSTTSATAGSGASGSGGNSGNGGDHGPTPCNYSPGAGGAGWKSNGTTAPTIRNTGGKGGEAPRNGAEGGYGYHPNYGAEHCSGGFGGGGGGSDNTGAGGGGGGYNGGGGGRNYCGSSWGAGGGGGSYNSGADQSGQTGANDNHGYVTITYACN